MNKIYFCESPIQPMISISLNVSSFRVQSLFGGVGEMRDRLILNHKLPNIVVGTPGRLLALLKSKRLNLRSDNFHIILLWKVHSVFPDGDIWIHLYSLSLNFR